MKKNRYMNIFFVGLVLILIQTFLQYNSEFTQLTQEALSSIKPFIYAIFIAVIISPLVNFLEIRLKIKRSLSIGISLIFVILCILGLLLVIVPNIVVSISDLIDKFPSLLKRLNDNTKYLISFLGRKNIYLFDSNELEENIINFIKVNLSNLRNIAFGLGAGVAKSLIGIGSFLLGGFISLYLLNRKEYFINFLKNIFILFSNEKKAEKGVNFVKKVNTIFLKYILGRLITSIVVGLVVFIVMIATNSPYALLSAVMIAVGNMIPYVGSIIAGAISTFLIFLISPVKIIYLFIAIAIGQAVDGFLIGPRIMAESVGMSSFWTIISVMVCGSFFGTLGMFLGVPIFVVIKMIYLEMLKQKGENKK